MQENFDRKIFSDPLQLQPQIDPRIGCVFCFKRNIQFFHTTKGEVCIDCLKLHKVERIKKLGKKEKKRQKRELIKLMKAQNE